MTDRKTKPAAVRPADLVSAFGAALHDAGYITTTDRTNHMNATQSKSRLAVRQTLIDAGFKCVGYTNHNNSAVFNYEKNGVKKSVVQRGDEYVIVDTTPAPKTAALTNWEIAIVPTTPTDKTRIDSMFASMQTTMQNLHARWQDEHEHEKISDYAAAIKLPAGFNLIRMTARPFGFEFDIGTGARYFVSITRTSYRWGRK